MAVANTIYVDYFITFPIRIRDVSYFELEKQKKTTFFWSKVFITTCMLRFIYFLFMGY